MAADQRARKPQDPKVLFSTTPGAAQALQIDSQVHGAEVIGSSLLYPGQASDQLLTTIENCLDQGVKG